MSWIRPSSSVLGIADHCGHAPIIPASPTVKPTRPLLPVRMTFPVGTGSRRLFLVKGRKAAPGARRPPPEPLHPNAPCRRRAASRRSCPASHRAGRLPGTRPAGLRDTSATTCGRRPLVLGRRRVASVRVISPSSGPICRSGDSIRRCSVLAGCNGECVSLAAMKGVSGRTTLRWRANACLLKPEKSLSISRTVIESSRSSTAVVGASSPGKSRIICAGH